MSQYIDFSRWGLPCAMALLLVLPQTAPAQSVCPKCSTEAEIASFLNSPAARAPAEQGSNTARITQFGRQNTALIDTTVPASAGGGSYFNNTAAIAQFGNNNDASLKAVGNSNFLVSTQLGSNNTSAISVFGDNNSVVNTQIGSNLSYSLQRVGNGAAIAVTQVQPRGSR